VKRKTIFFWSFSKNKIDVSDSLLLNVPDKVLTYNETEYLNMSLNRIFKLPKEIGKFCNLLYLFLDSNKLQSFPMEITELKSLKNLNLSNNLIKHIPPEIKKLTNLETLFLSLNRIKKLPLEIAELKKLNFLYLNQNQLNYLPDIFLNTNITKNLRTLYLRENFLPPNLNRDFNFWSGEFIRKDFYVHLCSTNGWNIVLRAACSKRHNHPLLSKLPLEVLSYIEEFVFGRVN